MTANPPLFLRYPNAPGFKERTTSQEAAVRAMGFAPAIRQRCLEALRTPMTPKELAQRLNLDKDSVRPRCTELLLAGKLRRVGRRDGQHVLMAVE